MILYSPLTEPDLSVLFPEYASSRKIWSWDAIIESVHGERYELHSFKIRSAVLDTKYPSFSQLWQGRELPQEIEIIRWTETPVELDYFNDLPESVLKKRFLRMSNEKSCYYCCLHVSFLESYWFVYNQDKEKLYYLICDL